MFECHDLCWQVCAPPLIADMAGDGMLAPTPAVTPAPPSSLGEQVLAECEPECGLRDDCSSAHCDSLYVGGDCDCHTRV